MMEAVSRRDRSCHDIGVGLGELEGVGLENQVIVESFGESLRSGELNPPETPGFPVDAISGDFNGED